MSVEVYRTQRRATDRALRSGNINDVHSIDGSCLATVVNAQLLLPNTTLTIPNTTLTIQSDFLCPMTQLVPEDAVIFGRMFYERESAKQIPVILETATKQDRTVPNYLLFDTHSLSGKFVRIPVVGKGK